MEPVHCLRVDGLTGTLYFEVMDSHFFQDEYFFQVDSQRQNQEMFSHRLQRQDLPCASRNPSNKLVMLKIMASFSFWLLSRLLLAPPASLIHGNVPGLSTDLGAQRSLGSPAGWRAG